MLTSLFRVDRILLLAEIKGNRVYLGKLGKESELGLVQKSPGFVRKSKSGLLGPKSRPKKTSKMDQRSNILYGCLYIDWAHFTST